LGNKDWYQNKRYNFYFYEYWERVDDDVFCYSVFNNKLITSGKRKARPEIKVIYTTIDMVDFGDYYKEKP
jgi:hypothetical protein